MKNWEKKKLGEVCIVERGSSPRPIEKYQTDSPDGVNWIKIGDTKGVDKYIFSTKEKITKEGAEKSRYVKEGDFILSNSMSFGKPYIMKTDGYIHDGWFVFRLPDYLDKDYFYYLLTSPNVQEQIQSLGAGAIVKNISGDLVKKVDVTYPKSLPEQQRIVSILDEAFAAIAKAKANAEQNLKNAKELFESYLQGVFEKKGDGWEEQLLEDCFKLKSGDNLTAKNMNEGNYPVFGGNGIAGYHNEYNLSGSNVIIGRVGALCGNVRHITENIWLTDNAFKVVDFKFDFDHLFLTYLLNHKHLRSFARQAAQPVISNSSLKDVVLYFPKSLKEQQAIVGQLDALRTETQKLEAVYRQKIVDLEELKKSVLAKAFAGELRSTEGARSLNDGSSPS